MGRKDTAMNRLAAFIIDIAAALGFTLGLAAAALYTLSDVSTQIGAI